MTDSKSISLEDFNQFLHKVIAKNEPSRSDEEIDAIIEAYLKESNIIFNSNFLLTSIILDRAKSSSSAKTYITATLINLFSSQNENIIAILNQCLSKLKEYKETGLAQQLNWVILLLDKDHFKVEIDSNDVHAIQYMKEYSCDVINQSKEKDLAIAKNLSLERERKGKRNSVGIKSKFQANLGNGVNRTYKRTYSALPKSVFQSFDIDKAKAKISALDSDSVTKKRISLESDIPTYIEEKQEGSLSHTEKAKEEEDEPLAGDQIEGQSEEDDDDNEEGKVEKDEEKEEKLIKVRFDKCQTEQNDNKSISNNSNIANSSSSLPFFIAEKQANTLFDDIDFNIFNYVEETGRIGVLYNISNSILTRYNFFSFINTERFHTFIDKIRVGYDYLIPYHNDLHAADVLQTCHFIINSKSIKAELDLTSLDICGLFIAAIVHDFKHPGLNNTYHMNKRTAIAIRYNDFSILEQLHISSAFKVLSHPNSNIFCDLSAEEFRIIRKRMVECVLGTDMARHAKALNILRKKVDHLNEVKDSTGSSICELLINYIPDENKFDRQQELLTFIIHCADISNTGKIFPICRAWTMLVMTEFFMQGDKEKEENLPVSFLCDREKTAIPKSQVSFISNIGIPCFNTLEMLFPHCQIFVKNQKDNIANWELEQKDNSKDHS